MSHADLDSLVAAARRHDRVALARLLSVTERGGDQARDLAAIAWPEAKGFSIGVTGAPGAGKSTLVDRMITTALARFVPERAERPVAEVGVLCVDPSSPLSGGAILGDRVRMQDHALDDRVYIRSLATRGHHGGLSLAVPDAISVLEACGFELVIVETVGVGQVELEVAATATVTVVVVTPGWGDAMQAAKAGILEVADLFVVNKADRPGAAEAVRDLAQMLDLGHAHSGFRPAIVETTASTGAGTDELFDAIDAVRDRLRGDEGALRRRARAASVLRRLYAHRVAALVDEVASTPAFDDAVTRVVAGELDPYSAVEGLVAR